MSFTGASIAPASPDQSAARAPSFPFQNTYARLPDHFFARLHPTPVAAPKLIQVNTALAAHLRLDAEALAGPQGVAVLSGNQIAEGSEPLAQAYAGSQFGYFVPLLGDGRTNLLGEVVARDGKLYDIQLKGSGPTPFSRRGDGRAALGPVLREYIVSEAMAALGVPTTRALAAVTTGEHVVREGMLPGAILTRVAWSHLRVGTFQYFAKRGDIDDIRTLADFAIARHYPEAAHAAKPYRAFLDGVIERQAKLVAQWMGLGFIHGVMNTDNTSISGETIDYGPCAFLEAYQPNKVFSSIDQQGRYAYSNQPDAMHWNLTRLAESILPLLIVEEGSDEAGLATAYAALATFATHFEAAREQNLRQKLGLTTQQEGDNTLAEDLLQRMAANRADFTLTFRRLAEAAADASRDADVRALFADPSSFDTWAIQWRQRLAQEASILGERTAQMLRTNPAIIPRNHQVQAVIDAAVQRQDFQPFRDLLHATADPYQDSPETSRFTTPALPNECVFQTFCGT
ncbi:hypothetical protein Terro_3382 [Terriglobus roseus DSM 18391]|uniref:Protein nucleotidyltransferase YdiU n=1 Tax=Terriglobus roseus (strain DSM 18391 / NRRL B-41598 / KBS 63) TaxID=926566 RepID=I3ZK29_TERRK|nr:YdiU family protein [Terriglobus roseus]AFL89597.1 hypothetical protein Terro_3382 [Terriglobus roseus DSM 18391]